MPTATKTEAAFWDASGVALLCTHQSATSVARRLVQRCGRIIIWWGTPVETRSAFRRLFRERLLASTDLADAIRRLAAIRRVAGEILPTEEMRALAESMLDEYELRAGRVAELLVEADEPPPAWLLVAQHQRRGQLEGVAESAGFTLMPRP